jgi:site-specific recombinase XerD
MKKRVKVVFDRKGSVAKTGYGKIELCIYLKEGERKYETVGTATPDNWEAAAQDKNIVAKIKHYEQMINAMQLFNEDMTIKNFNNHVLPAEAKASSNATIEKDGMYFYKGTNQKQSFIEYIEACLEKEGLRSGSRRNIEVVKDNLKKSGIIKRFYDLTPANIQKYDEYLHNQGDKSQATICNYHKKLHKYTNMLWRSDMIPSNPYNQFEIKRGTSKERQPLTEDELIVLRNAKLSSKLERVRDLFIFMAYTGLAYIDMCHFNFSEMAEKNGRLYYIDGKRTKTGSQFYAPILPPAMDVLKKYNYKLPTISNQKLNDYLDIIREKLEWKKKITCHVARHSFATLLLTYDFTVEKTARALGHKDIKTTQIYAKVLKKTIVDKTEKLVAEIK